MTSGKAGLLRVLSSNSSRKGPHAFNLTAWMDNHTPKWWLVRESYLVAVGDPGELQIDDVFLLDADFAIERPKRVYRQGLNLLHIGTGDDEELKRQDWDITVNNEVNEKERKGKANEANGHINDDHHTDAGTILSRSTMSKFFSIGRRHRGGSVSTKGDDPRGNGGHPTGTGKHLTIPNRGGKEEAPKMSDAEERDASPERRPLGIEGNVSQADLKPVDPNKTASDHRTANPDGTAVANGVPDPHVHGERFRRESFTSSDDANHPNMLIDPSIGRDPRHVGEEGDKKKKKKKTSKDVSQHTFYLKNGQRKLKFVAKNEVCWVELPFSFVV